jgi:hypothetical protein
MIKNITIINHLGESLHISMTEPEKSGFIIKSITGLGPVKADTFFSEFTSMDGSIDNGSRLNTRNIVMNFMFLEKPSIEATRLLSYKYFPIKQNITFRIETDARICETVGRVESNEPDIFSEKEGCSISMICPDPYFYSSGKLNRTVFSGIENVFEFPFSNESLDENLLEMSRINLKKEGTVFYEGDSQIGITIRIHTIGPVSGLKIYNINTREVFAFNDERFEAAMGSGMKAGDDITIVTNKGKKSVTILRDGITKNILHTIDKPMTWFQISKGDNLFAYRADEGEDKVQLTIENQVIYEGV